MTTPRPILFLGATGGCANSALMHTLRSTPPTPCIALARTPSKLLSQLTSQSITPTQLANLTIITGNALSIPSLKTALLAHPSGQLPATIITGLGATPQLQLSLCQPFAMDDPHVCEGAARALVSALREVYAERPELEKGVKPSVVFISTTGISRGKEDVPFAMRWLYHQVLATPHLDKSGMEDVLRGEAEGQGEKGQGVFRAVSGVRPTLLTGKADVSDGRGWESVRAGTEEEPELGYTVARADVGEWVFENLVREGARRERWEGQMVSLTS